MNCDVVIVGSGPAGSAAAITLAGLGHDVVMVDSKSFPRDKVCGDGVLPAAVKVLDQLGLKDKVLRGHFNSIERVKVVAQDNTQLEVGFTPVNGNSNFIIAPRFKLDQILHEKALASGVKYHNARVCGLVAENGQVRGVKIESHGPEEEIRGSVVIGADGSNSIVRRRLSGRSLDTGSIHLGIRGYLESSKHDTHLAEVHFHSRPFAGYSWVFPVSENRINIGLGLHGGNYSSGVSHIRQLLDRFLENYDSSASLAGRKILGIGSWYYQLAPWKRMQMSFDGAILCGDAASLMDPLSGEGIHNALKSGILAAEAIHDGFGKNDFSRAGLKKYEDLVDDEIYPVIRRSIILRKIILSRPLNLKMTLKAMGIVKPLLSRTFGRFSRNFHFK